MWVGVSVCGVGAEGVGVDKSRLTLSNKLIQHYSLTYCISIHVTELVMTRVIIRYQILVIACINNELRTN